MAERLPEGHIVSCSSTVPIAANSADLSNQLPCESTLTDMMTPERDSNGSFANQILPNGSKAQQTGKTEWVVQDEPGVYITLSSLPGGGNELKRVRFRYVHYANCQPFFCIKKYCQANKKQIICFESCVIHLACIITCILCTLFKFVYE